MQIVKTISHSDFLISVFSWNGKYLLKFENSALEQTYKISQMDIQGLDTVDQMLENEDFLMKVKLRFEMMKKDWLELLAES